jgi:hypothetical protein
VQAVKIPIVAITIATTASRFLSCFLGSAANFSFFKSIDSLQLVAG